MSQEDFTVKCRGECGKSHPDAEAAKNAGWAYLWITRGDVAIADENFSPQVR